MINIDYVTNYQDIKEYLYSLKHFAKPETAKCAKGRLNFWNDLYPSYSQNLVRHANKISRLTTLRKTLYPESDLCQVFFADDFKGIAPHSDWKGFEDKAMILNMGAGVFTVNNSEYFLTGGELITFNCRERHSYIPNDESRIGLGIWKLKKHIRLVA